MDQAQKSRIKVLMKEAKEALMKATKDGPHPIHYVSRRPTKSKPGWVLAHNHVRHTVDMAIDRNGFRAWWFYKSVPDAFKPCRCGWGTLPHVSASPNYKCEPERVIAAFD